MTLNDYREQFRRNLMVMSRTANGRLDLSASATKADSMAAGSAGEARDKALENTDRALEFLFENRRRRFMSVKELEELVLEECRRIWDMFTEEYYRDVQEEIRQKKTAQAELIGTVLALAKFIKNGAGPGLIAPWVSELERLADAAE